MTSGEPGCAHDGKNLRALSIHCSSPPSSIWPRGVPTSAIVAIERDGGVCLTCPDLAGVCCEGCDAASLRAFPDFLRPRDRPRPRRRRAQAAVLLALFVAGVGPRAWAARRGKRHV